MTDDQATVAYLGRTEVTATLWGGQESTGVIVSWYSSHVSGDRLYVLSTGCTARAEQLEVAE